MQVCNIFPIHVLLSVTLLTFVFQHKPNRQQYFMDNESSLRCLHDGVSSFWSCHLMRTTHQSSPYTFINYNWDPDNERIYHCIMYNV